MSVQLRSLSHRRRLTSELWTPAEQTADGYTPAHWYRSDQGLWQDAGVTPAASDGDPVGQWDDLTANADHISQGTAANKPTLQNEPADLLNGHPVLRFDGTDDYLKGTFTTGGTMSQPNTVVIVAKLDAAAVDDGVAHILFNGIANSHRNNIFTDTTATPDAWAFYAGSSVTGGADDSNWHIFIAQFNGAASYLWLEGVLNASGDVGAEDIGGLNLATNVAASAFWDGDIAEALLYNAALSDTAINQAGRYLAQRYGLTYTDI